MALRETNLNINIDAIKHNIEELRHSSKKEIIGVIKANAYGVGMIEMAKVLLFNKINILAVSSLDEALILRKSGISSDVLVLGYTSAKHYKIALENNIILTVNSLDFVRELSLENVENLRVHIKIDTKMHRIGFTKIDNFTKAIDDLLKLKVEIEGVFTHYACSDYDDKTTNEQYQLFEKYLKSTNFKFKWIHASNSDGALHFDNESKTNAIRSGIALLGYAKYHQNLLPALSLTTAISQINHLKKGDSVSYGATYCASESEIIATLPIGYGDGFIRANQGRSVYLNNEYANIIGRICMDQMIIKISKEYPIGSEVEIFGQHIDLFKMAEELNTIVYEIITLIANRVNRRYYENNKLTNKYK
ncbi:MAG: alanine racemase [Erysipelotrichaceae bacterium]